MKHFLSPVYHRLTVSLLSLTLCMPFLSAKIRTAEEAKQTAEQYLTSITSAPQATLSQQSLTRSDADNYFVFDIKDNGGYIIVAADDRFQDILGYTDKGNFSSAIENPNLRFWLAALSEEMKAQPKASLRQVPTRAVNAVVVEPLIKTKWGQGKPFNNYCPDVYDYTYRETVKAPAGCVATAMAQVLRYHKWPLSYITSSGDTYEYKWDSMHEVYSYEGTESEESIDQVASLLKHCGESVNMKYEADGSSAFISDMENALISKFGYDPSSLRHIERDMYGYEEVHNLLYNELSEGRPVLTRGDYPGADGHAFVLDGSTADGFFHFNWGWSGYCDGYYRITALRPSDYGTGGSASGYSFNVSFSIGVKPARYEVTDTTHPDFTAYGDLSLYYDSDCGQHQYSDKMIFYVTTKNSSLSGFLNTGLGTFNGGYDEETHGRFYTLLTNMDTGEETLSERYVFMRYDLPPQYYVGGMNLYADNLADNTRYKATIVYKNGPADTIHTIRYAPGCRSYIVIERKGDEVYVSMPPAESTITASLPEDLTRIVQKSGNNATYKVKISNPGDTEYLGQVKWQYTNSDDYTNDWYSDYAMVNIIPGEEDEVEFTLYNLKKVTPGTYTIGLYDFRNRLIGPTRQVEVCEYRLDIDETNFPDEVFRTFVAENYDNNGDGILSDAEVGAVYYVNLSNVEVADLTGVENFYNAYGLSVSSNKLTNLDLSSGPWLDWLDLKDCPLESLCLDGQKQLYSLTLNNANLKQIDLSGLPALLDLYVNGNLLTELDLSGHPDLRLLSCNNNQIEKLDLTGLDKLEVVYASQNGMKELKLSTYPLLSTLNIRFNNLEGKIDLSDSPALYYVDLSNNKLNELELCDMPELTYLYLGECNLSGKLDLSASEKIEDIDISNNSFSELILGPTSSLSYLNIRNNSISGGLDISEARNLWYVDIGGNQIEGIVFGEHPELDQLSLYDNQIEGTLDISGMPNLNHLFASDNKISRFKHADHPSLMTIDLARNALTHLHVEPFLELIYYNVSEQELSATISTPNFSLASMTEAGFEPDRASQWEAVWMDGSVQKRAACEVVNGEVVIPDEAGRDLSLNYTYIIHRDYNWIKFFTINVTREGFDSVEDLIADGVFSIDGNTLTFADGVTAEVYTPAGVSVFKGVGQTNALPTGIYIVRIGSSIVKIAIP